MVSASEALEETGIGALKDFGKTCLTKQVRCSILTFGSYRRRRKQDKLKRMSLSLRHVFEEKIETQMKVKEQLASSSMKLKY